MTIRAHNLFAMTSAPPHEGATLDDEQSGWVKHPRSPMGTDGTKRVQRVIVAIPARNEEALLGGCLLSVAHAIEALHGVRPDIPVDTVVALDGCTDQSAAVVSRAGVHAVFLRGAGVGTTRDAAISHGLSLADSWLDASSEHHTWVACTDADSLVGSTWLIRQITWAESGMDLVLGSVEPHGPVSPAVLAAWHSQHRLGEGHPHVHGANLGMRAHTWRAAGGFGPHTVGEDVGLVSRVKAQGNAWVATDTTRVATSARLQGRVTGGFADYLSDLREPG